MIENIDRRAIWFNCDTNTATSLRPTAFDNYAYVARRLFSQLHSQKLAHFMDEDLPFVTVHQMKQALDMPDERLRTRAVQYGLSYVDFVLDPEHNLQPPDYYEAVANNILTAKPGPDALVADILTNQKGLIIAARYANGSAQPELVTLRKAPDVEIVTERDTPKGKLPSNLEELLPQIADAYHTLCIAGADIQFPVSPKVLRGIGISQELVTFLHEHDIIRLIMIDNHHRYDETDAVFALMLGHNFNKPNISHEAKRLAKWYRGMKEQFLQKKGVLYEAGIRAGYIKTEDEIDQ